jgi:signal transduction histidine kinase
VFQSQWGIGMCSGGRFDTTTIPPGTGLQGMADRLAALGGALHIRSQPGEGTILSGELPLTASGQGLRRLQGV